MQRVYDEIKSLGGDVLVVSFAPPEKVAAYLQKYPQPFPVVSDPDRAAYRAFALGNTSPGRVLRPGNLLRHLVMILRGAWPRKPAANDDLWQLGGDFLLDADGKLRYAYPSGNSADRPSARTLLDELRRIRA